MSPIYQIVLAKGNLSRLEPKNRTHNFEEGLQARVKDPLWMLGRQWQLDEFKACNSGSIARVEVKYKTKRINAIIAQPDSEEQNEEQFPSEKIPMEIIVEAEKQNNQETPEKPDAWNSSRLEYAFDAVNGDSHLTSKEYDGNNLDWYDFNLVNAGTMETEHSFALKPSPTSFSGMPNPRFWQFEDRKMDIGKIHRSHVNYLQWIMTEYAFIYSNDWFIIPLQQEVGTLRKIEQIKIIDDFGVISYARPAVDESQGKTAWEVFTLSNINNGISDGTLFYLPNTVYKGLESIPMEKLHFIRDEMANLVWALEEFYEEAGIVVNRNDEETRFTCRICGEEIKSESELILHIEAEHPKYWDVKNEKVVSKDKITRDGEPGRNFIGPLAIYQLMSYVPIHWIPYLPKQQNISEQFVLRRGRTVVDTDRLPQYRGTILDESKYIYEEEIPRSGISVVRIHQIARDTDGDIYHWRSRKKIPDERRKTSGLVFDRIIPLK